nr:DUF4365 domain-containing protein [Phytoactinopolyspora mesophila]
MSELPRVLTTSTTERFGVNHVERHVIKSGCMWRELTTHDVGIDGHIEYVYDDLTTGHSVAVQIKSGTSYLEDGPEGFFQFTPTAKHRSYWERSAYPVILALVDPDAEVAYWGDARAALRCGHTNYLPYGYGIEYDFFLWNEDFGSVWPGRPITCHPDNDDRFWANKAPDSILDEFWGPPWRLSNVPDALAPFFD